MKYTVIGCTCIIGLLLFSNLTYGQSLLSNTKTWSSVQTINSDSTITVEVTSLIMVGSESLIWKNSEGAVRKSFEITETIGNWPFADGESEMRFEVTESGNRGTILISMDTNGLFTANINLEYEQPQFYRLVLQQ